MKRKGKKEASYEYVIILYIEMLFFYMTQILYQMYLPHCR